MWHIWWINFISSFCGEISSLKSGAGRYGLDLSGLGQRQVVVCSEHGNEISGSIKLGEFLG